MKRFIRRQREHGLQDAWNTWLRLEFRAQKPHGFGFYFSHRTRGIIRYLKLIMHSILFPIKVWGSIYSLTSAFVGGKWRYSGSGPFTIRRASIGEEAVWGAELSLGGISTPPIRAGWFPAPSHRPIRQFQVGWVITFGKASSGHEIGSLARKLYNSKLLLCLQIHQLK
jgi:hypothetical protein